MSKILKILKYWLPPLVWMGAIFFFSSRPVISTSEFYWQDFVVKKTAHLAEYAMLSLLFYRAFLVYGLSKQRAIFWAIVLSVVYAASDEFHQSFVPGRQSTLRDVLIDSLGSGLPYLFLK